MNIITPYELGKISVRRIIIYLRKSRSEGKESVEQVLARHEKILQDYAIEVFGEKIPEENIYREVVSGETLDERIEIKKVFRRLEHDEADVLLVVEPQRISRGGMIDCGRVVQILEYTETLCVTVTKTYDLSNKFDKELFEAQLLQGNKYLEYQKEILERGRALSVREGKYIGSTPPFGYDRKPLDKGFMLVKHKEEGPIVETIFNLFVNENLSTKEISSYLNKHGMKSSSGILWDYKMVKHILKHEVYYGSLAWGKRPTIKKLIDGEVNKFRITAEEFMLVRGMHEPIVSKEMWDIAQEKIKAKAHTRAGTSKEIKNPLAGLVFCKKCGYAMVRLKNRRKRDAKKRIRKYKLNKEAINKLLRESKEAKGLSLQEIADFLEVTKDTIVCWFGPNIDRVYYSELFTKKWYELKFILEIDTTKYDRQIMTYTDPEPLKDTLMCSNQHCDMISCVLQTFEAAVIKKLEEQLNEFKYFVDNYEEEIIKEQANNKKLVTRLTNKLNGLNKELVNTIRAKNREELTYDQYIIVKTEVENEITEIQNRLAEIEAEGENDTLIRYKKAIPIISECLIEYDNMSIPEKNETLKTIINRITYSKTKRLHWRRNDGHGMEIGMDLKV